MKATRMWDVNSKANTTDILIDVAGMADSFHIGMLGVHFTTSLNTILKVTPPHLTAR